VRQGRLDGTQILAFYEWGLLRPDSVFDDDQVEDLRDLVAAVAVHEQDEGRLYDLLDPSLWPDADEPENDPSDDVASGTTEKPRNVDFMFNLWRLGPPIREFAFDTTLAQWAAQLIGTSAVRLLEDNALWKARRFGSELKWHQDFPYWPLAQPNAVTALIALDDTDEENGAMSVAVGSHLTGERLPAAFGTETPYLQDMRPPVVKSIEDSEAIGLEVETVRLRAGRCCFARRSLGTYPGRTRATDNNGRSSSGTWEMARSGSGRSVTSTTTPMKVSVWMPEAPSAAKTFRSSLSDVVTI
jgi:hypothetical protein